MRAAPRSGLARAGFAGVSLAGLLLVGVPCAGAAGIEASAVGSVFDDRNGNGRRDAGEPGIADVLVSNGRDVARTDAAGGWSLPAGNDETFFVIQP